MSNMMKKLILASIGVSGIVAAAAIVDMIVGAPFSGKMVMDILFVVSAALVIYMGYETYQEST